LAGFDFAGALRWARLDPRRTLARRPDGALLFASVDELAGQPLLLDTCLYIDQMQGRTEAVPANPAVVETPVPSANGELVLIASMNYNDLPNEDSAFVVFGHSSNFGTGTENLVTPKKYPIPNPNPAVSNKPIIATANGYQITLQILSPPTTALPPNAAPPTPATPMTPVAPRPTTHQ
jgi:hypothetical protein